MHKEALGNVISKDHIRCNGNKRAVQAKLLLQYGVGRFLHAQLHTVLLLTFMAVHLAVHNTKHAQVHGHAQHMSACEVWLCTTWLYGNGRC